MAFEDRKNRGQYALSLGTPTVFTLPAGGKILRGRVIVTGTLVVTGGTTNGTVTSEGGPMGLIKRIRVIANRLAGSPYPGGIIVDCTPRSLLRYAISQRGKFIAEQSGSTLGNGAAGTYQIYLSIPIYWADSTLRNSMLTSLNADLGTFASIQVIVDTASDLTSCFTGNDRTIGAGTSLQVQWQDKRLAIPGLTTPLYQEEHVLQIQAANTRALDAAQPQDGILQQVLILAEQGTQRTLSDGIVNRVVMRGQTIDFDEYAKDVKQAQFDDNFFDAAQDTTGQYFIDFTEGVLLNGNPLPGLSVQYDLNNPSGAGADQLRIYTRRTYGVQAAA